MNHLYKHEVMKISDVHDGSNPLLICFWVIVPCRSMPHCQHLRDPYCFHLPGKVSQVGTAGLSTSQRK